MDLVEHFGDDLNSANLLFLKVSKEIELMSSFPYEEEVNVLLRQLLPSRKPLSPPAFSVLLPSPQPLHFPICDYYGSTVFSSCNSVLAKSDECRIRSQAPSPLGI